MLVKKSKTYKIAAIKNVKIILLHNKQPICSKGILNMFKPSKTNIQK